MGKRAQQREESRRRIIEAATTAFAERGFEATSTRDVAQLAGVNQGLITYYFGSKDALWKAAISAIFESLGEELGRLAEPPQGTDMHEYRRERLREYVRFVARHPELLRIMIEESNGSQERLRWLVENCVRPIYENFLAVSRVDGGGIDSETLPHLFYIVAGAASLMFTVRNECRMLTGIDPADGRSVEAHADLLVALLNP